MNYNNRCLKSSSEILVKPFSITLCPYLVTDKNWFKENILCFLSNALKYSHGGKVSLIITYVTANQQVNVPWEEEMKKRRKRFSERKTERERSEWK